MVFVVFAQAIGDGAISCYAIRHDKCKYDLDPIDRISADNCVTLVDQVKYGAD